jgi:hypothetical protein
MRHDLFFRGQLPKDSVGIEEDPAWVCFQEVVEMRIVYWTMEADFFLFLLAVLCTRFQQLTTFECSTWRGQLTITEARPHIIERVESIFKDAEIFGPFPKVTKHPLPRLSNLLVHPIGEGPQSVLRHSMVNKELRTGGERAKMDFGCANIVDRRSCHQRCAVEVLERSVCVFGGSLHPVCPRWYRLDTATEHA